MKTIMFPGQGSQFRGMGSALFNKYPEETEKASRILGYDIQKLCVEDPEKKLNQTQFTQPALYVVNALGYREMLEAHHAPDYLIGHSLGEYNALLAAGVFDFETGLRLVQKRGELMAEASGGGMAVILGCSIQSIRDILNLCGYTEIDIANFNTPSQTVIAGPKDAITKAIKDFEQAGIKIIPLNVSAAFHSRYMKNASELFTSFLGQFRFSSMQIPVIANLNAEPYHPERLVKTLAEQISHPVLWNDTVSWLLHNGVDQFEEIGGSFLTKMTTEIRSLHKPLAKQKPEEPVGISKKRRLFLLPFAGGNRYSYQFMLPYLKDFEVYPLELPGRGKRGKEPLVGSFFDAMGDVFRQISKEIEPDRDVIYGHSLGAILGHWVTYRLEKSGKSPARLIVSGIPRPSIRKSDSLQSVYDLPKAEFIERLIRMGGMPEELIENKEFFEYAEPILRADFKLLNSISDHQPNAIKTPLIAIMGTQESKAHEIEEWGNYTHGSLECHHMEGGHFFINNHPQTLVELISKSLL